MWAIKARHIVRQVSLVKKNNNHKVLCFSVVVIGLFCGSLSKTPFRVFIYELRKTNGETEEVRFCLYRQSLKNSKKHTLYKWEQ